MEWTTDNQNAADAEGWIISVGHEDGPRLERYDEAATFKNDAEAWRHVVGMALLRSPLHERALTFLAETNPTELRQIGEEVERHLNRIVQPPAPVTNRADDDMPDLLRSLATAYSAGRRHAERMMQPGAKFEGCMEIATARYTEDTPAWDACVLGAHSVISGYTEIIVDEAGIIETLTLG